MATRLTYTTGSRSAELDRAFEAALAEAREREAEPLTHLVGGREVAAGEAFDREDPSRREQVASRAHEGAELAAEAVEAAQAAQREWRRLPHAERVAVLRATERMIDDRKLELAAAISLEVGKVRTESIAEVEEAIDLIETYCRAGRVGRGIRDAPRAAFARRAEHRRPPSVRRFRRHRAVQLPVRARVRHDGRGSRRGQRRRTETAGGGTAVGRGRGPPARRGGRARRRHLARPWRPGDRRGSGGLGDRRCRLHRLGRGRPRDRATALRRALPEARARGDGRQERGHRRRECGPRSRRGGDREGSLRLLGPEVQRLLAGHRRGRGARRARRAARRARAGRRSSAIRPIPTSPPDPS